MLNPDHVRQVSIIGVGLIGGSVGLALRAAGYAGRIVGSARRQSTIDLASQRGCIDGGTTDLAAAVAEADLVVLTAPVSAICRMMPELAKADNGRMVVTDAGSTKASIVDAAQRCLPDPARFMGSHPMAGTEESGPGAAFAELYTGKAVIITPTDTTAPATIERISDLWRTLRMRLVWMAPHDADLAAARISHLPHALAAMLVDLAGRTGAIDVASTGFADVTRVASGGPELWTQIFIENADAIVDVLDESRRAADHLRELVARRDADALHELLTRAKATRDQWVAQRRVTSQ